MSPISQVKVTAMKIRTYCEIAGILPQRTSLLILGRRYRKTSIAVIATIAAQGTNTLRAHLEHLRRHGQTEYLAQALAWLTEQGIAVPEASAPPAVGGCPGSRAQRFVSIEGAAPAGQGAASRLTHWPVQLHLVSPAAPAYRGADLLLAADCVAYAVGDFHDRFLGGKALAIACPKLDEGQEVYEEKLKAMVEVARINTLTVAIMEVPCCGGLLRLAQRAVVACQRRVPVKVVVVGTRGEVLREEWVG